MIDTSTSAPTSSSRALFTWDPETGEFTCVDGPQGFETWQEAEEAGRFLRQVLGKESV